MPKIIVVSNRLPVTVRDGEIRKSSGGLVAALEGLPSDAFEMEWLGWPGQIVGDEAERARIGEVLRREWQSVPVTLSDEEMKGFYEGLSNSALWPLLHSMPTYMQFRDEWWKTYVEVNRKYADAILDRAEPGDLVWVHDYQLMLVPAMVREANRGVKVGYFLHTPFPPFDVFRFFPRRKELVEGLLGADLVGFHTFGYLSNFREAAERLLDLDEQATTEVDSICARGHAVGMGVFPIGIHASKFAAELASPEFPGLVANARRGVSDRQLVLSVERLDYTKGIVHRLEAIDLYLGSLAPEERERVEFFFVSVPSREDIEKYKELREDVEARVGRLNGKYATLTSNPIHFIRGHVEFRDLVALYASADVALVTPLVDGMNLVAKEYLAARADNRGVLVLSEFAGAAEELVGAIQVNPHDPAAVAGAIGRALAMPAAERERAAAPMRHRIMTEDSAYWARSFVSSLEGRPTPSQPCEHEVEFAREGDLVEVIGSSLASAWRYGGRASLFLDYDGTLREIVADPASATPTDELRELLHHLAQAPGLNVTVISGRTPEDMSRFLGDYPFALVAEHGAQVRVAHAGGPWMSGTKSDPAWRDALLPIVQLYERLTPGSHVEVKHTSLVWHYRNCNRDLGNFRARRLMRDLAGPTANLPVVIQRGRKIVEVRDASIDKGVAAARILRAHPSAFVLCAGDDVTDEALFSPPLAPTAASIKVGRGATSATHRLRSPAELRRVLLRALDYAAELHPDGDRATVGVA